MSRQGFKISYVIESLATLVICYDVSIIFSFV